jgi:hypothetical protein
VTEIVVRRAKAPLLKSASAEVNAGHSTHGLREIVSWPLAQVRARGRDPRRYLLVLRFALLGAAHVQGLVDKVFAADGTYLSVLIFLVFLGGLGI